MQMPPVVITLLASTFLVAACGSAPPPNAPANSTEKTEKATVEAKPVENAAPVEKAPSAPALVLGETSTAKLGTAPAGLGPKVGTKAPDGTLPDVTGKSVRLSALYGEGPTFVVFYRGGWCPFCNMQLHGIVDAKSDFEKKKINVIAISVDKPEEEAKTKAKHGVPFPMLSDSNLSVHKAFNVVHTPPEAEAKALAGYGIDLDKFSGQNHHSFAVPALVLVDRAGVVRWVHVDEDYKTRPTPKQMLEVADRVLTTSAK
jgi:peroxiredoxin